MKLLIGLTLTALAFGQVRVIAPGTNVTVRTNESINVRQASGQVFSGTVQQEVFDRDGNIVIPRGADAELVVRNVGPSDLAVDLESVAFNGQRYAISADSAQAIAGRRSGLGGNRRTGEYVGGGAVIGSIIGAIAGGAKGAAIGAAAGAAAGAGTQVLTRGQNVYVPSESLLTFRLERPLEVGVADVGYTNGGRHYHYRSGLGESSYAPQTVTCSSFGGRTYCDADTRYGVRMMRQLSARACREGSSWGYNDRGIWVDRGCQAEFDVSGGGSASYANPTYSASPVICNSENGQRTFCSADTRGGVRLRRQLGGAACVEGSSWGYDSRGIWVDRGCRGEFDVRSGGQ